MSYEPVDIVTGGSGSRDSGGQPDPCFAATLEQRGESIAVILPGGGTVTYGRLAQLADDWAARLGTARRLVHLAADNDLSSLVAYLGCLRHGHPVILSQRGLADLSGRLAKSFKPDAAVEWRNGDWFEELHVPQGGLHRDLALLLLTSGSTGEMKLVRLSRNNIEANARAISTYLGIDTSHRAATTLPFYYSYGLSVINSHLAAGASLYLTAASLTDMAFWEDFRQFDCTSFAGVPYSFKLLDKDGFDPGNFPSLRYITQAGGKLEPAAVRHHAEQCAIHGVKFFVMYGQTEASPRIAYLPPELAASHPDSIGIAIPGGQLSLRDEAGHEIEAAGVAGELVYRGPNVMMGYALSREDLAAGPQPPELATGDLAVRDNDGLYSIVGRKSRFSKIAGLRISFDGIERRLRELGIETACTGNDDGIAVATTGEAEEQAELAKTVARIAGIPATFVSVIVLADIPRLPSGKTDYPRIMKAAASRQESASSRADFDVIEAYRDVFPGIAVTGTSTLESLGGDSLAELELAYVLERQFGSLPEGWQMLTAGQLQARFRAAERAPAEAARTSNSSNTTANTLRGLACLGIVFQHTVGENPLQGLRLDPQNPLLATQYFVDFFGTGLLIFMAGYLTAWPLQETVAGTLALLRLRLIRLIIPLLTVTTLYYTLRNAMGLAEPLSYWQALAFPYLHLWFLQALAVLTVIAAAASFVCKADQKRMAILLAIPAALLFVWGNRVLPQFFSLAYVSHRLPFYVLGIAARAWTVTAIRQRSLIVQAAWFGGLAAMAGALEVPAIVQFNSSTGPVPDAFSSTTLAGLPAALAICLLLITAQLRIRLLSLIGTLAMEVYLFHILFVAAFRRMLYGLGLGASPRLDAIIVWSLAVAFSILLGRLILKSRILSFAVMGRVSGIHAARRPQPAVAN